MLEICYSFEEYIITRMNIPEIEEKNVVNVYNKISDDFSRTRYKAWPCVKSFVESFPPDAKFLEVGSGNGKNMLLRPDKFKGCDISEGFVRMCKNIGLDVVHADATDLPFDDNSFDATMSIAVIHHLSSAERRVTAVSEMARVTKCGGKILIEVWGYEDNNRVIDGNPDSMVTWKVNGTTEIYERYYHFFKKEEITELVSSVDSITIDSIEFEKCNWVIHATKI
jgi:tRNA (uracil-5-)-methyltransferase TRM9